MKRAFLFPLILTALAQAAAGTPEKMIAALPVYERVGHADVVLMGTVTRLEDKTITLPDRSEYQIAVVQVREAILDAKELKEVRVGFRSGWLKPKQEVCLFLSRKPGQNFLFLPLYFDAIAKSAPSFAKDVEVAKRCAKLLADPDAGLKAENAEERLLTASLLLTRYRTVKEGQTKQELIDAEQSKQILEAIIRADWSKSARADQPSAQQTFAKLGLSMQRDGWRPPDDYKDLPEQAKLWLKANAERFRIQKHVAEKND
jgi:hypothetical protein